MLAYIIASYFGISMALCLLSVFLLLGVEVETRLGGLLLGVICFVIPTNIILIVIILIGNLILRIMA